MKQFSGRNRFPVGRHEMTRLVDACQPTSSPRDGGSSAARSKRIQVCSKDLSPDAQQGLDTMMCLNLKRWWNITNTPNINRRVSDRFKPELFVFCLVISLVALEKRQDDSEEPVVKQTKPKKKWLTCDCCDPSLRRRRCNQQEADQFPQWPASYHE